MNQNRLKFLLKKNSINQCSSGELEELEDWFNSRDFGDKGFNDWLKDAGREEELSAELFKDFTQRTQIPKKIFFNSTSMRIAAAILVLTCIGTLFFLKRNPDSGGHSHQNKNCEIKPGGDKATLTLSDGSQIVLNNSANGHLATQKGININKDSPYKISYQLNEDKNNLNRELVYNTMTTPRGGRFSLTLSDGTDVVLDAESSIKYPVVFNGKERKVSITGQVYFNVDHDEKHPFFVLAKGQLIEDVGTAFNVNAYSDNPSVKITLEEGKVNIKNEKNKVSLIPGEQAEVMDSQQSIKIKHVNVNEVTAWRKGWFVFHNESIKNVMKEASRWYDIEIQFKGDVNNKRFGGTISRYKDITELLDNLKITGGIDYKIEGRRVILIN